MNFSDLQQSLEQHKKQILIGLGTGIVIVALIAGLIGGNTGLFTGDTTGGDGTGDPLAGGEGTVDACETTPAKPFSTLLGEINNQIVDLNGLDTINLDEELTTAALDTLLISLAAIVPDPDVTTYDGSNCFSILDTAEAEASIEDIDKYIDKIDTIKEAITAFNDKRVECQVLDVAECQAVELDQLEITVNDLSCDSGRDYNSTSEDCQDEVLTCEYTDLHGLVLEANELLEDFSDDPEDFDSSDEDDLMELLDQIKDELEVPSQAVFDDFVDNFDYEEQAEDLSAIFDDFVDNFDYEEQAEDLSAIFVEIVDTITESEDPCEDLDTIEEIEIDTSSSNSNSNSNDEGLGDVNSLLNGGNDNTNFCPRYATYDTLLESCICDENDVLVSASGTCPAFSADEEDPGDSENSFVCEDGEIVSDISACIVDNSEFDPSTLPGDPAADAGDIEIGLDEEDLLGTADPINEADAINDAINALDPNGANNSTNTVQTLNSTTNASVMQSGIIQGDTGPGLLVSLILSFAGTFTYYTFSTRRRF
jgi:hypothetical protein